MKNNGTHFITKNLGKGAIRVQYTRLSLKLLTEQTSIEKAIKLVQLLSEEALEELYTDLYYQPLHRINKRTHPFGSRIGKGGMTQPDDTGYYAEI